MRSPRFTRDSDGKPRLRLLEGSKAVLLFVMDMHDRILLVLGRFDYCSLVAIFYLPIA
jgi:hypothetical protein